MKKIGFYGYPPESLLQSYEPAEWIDLDLDYGYPDTGILPTNCCAIIKNIVNNAFYLKKELTYIIATTGEDKCDNGRFVALLLKQYGFPVIFSSNQNNQRKPTPICESFYPLKDRINWIMNNIVKKKPLLSLPRIEKKRFGFWGVPPNDFRILELFPDDTVIYGWIRCVEASVPADLELELFCEPEVKTVFFAQSFCSKTLLAKNLAEKYGGLFIDMEKNATHSILAKIEAFLRLSQ